ncbi:MAG: hypothetical protein HY914_08600 [Desulfomonile tiedjei]|nr:hypothetical protein [Desulfomonile tiedjei]
MPENLKDILYSLLPLILIIFISWFFSFLGPKMKKQIEEGTKAGNGESRNELLEIFLGQGSAKGAGPPAESPEPRSEMPGPGLSMPGSGVPAPGDKAAPMPLPRYTGPPVTPEPIKPKWWGA